MMTVLQNKELRKKKSKKNNNNQKKNNNNNNNSNHTHSYRVKLKKILAIIIPKNKTSTMIRKIMMIRRMIFGLIYKMTHFKCKLKHIRKKMIRQIYLKTSKNYFLTTTKLIRRIQLK